jgi:hypothetical protein
MSCWLISGATGPVHRVQALVHVGHTGGPQLIQLRHQVPHRVRRSIGTHLFQLNPRHAAPHERDHGFILGG